MLTSKFAVSLLFYITIALTISSSHASMDTMDMNRRHGNIGRMIKMRSPAGGLGEDLGIGGGGGGGGNGGGTTGTETGTQTSSATQTSSNTSANTSKSIPGLFPPASQTTTTSSSSETTSSSSSSQSTGLSTSSTPSASVPPTQTTNSITGIPSATFGTNSISHVVVTSTDSSSAASASPSPAPPSTNNHTTITVLIVIAASVGGIAIIWTIIRKWKFRPSSQFEDRMQPIDWQPTTGEDGAFPAHRRMGSNASSFLSGSGHHGDNMAGQAGYGAASDHGHAGLAGLPDHDFTAGASHFAPVGGYADLSRGMPEQPPMQEYNRMHYDHYGVSQQHQAYSQDAYDYNAGAY